VKPIVTRTLSGAVYIVLMLGSVILGPYAFGIVQGLFLLLCLIEFQKMFFSVGFANWRTSFLIDGVISYIIVLLFLWDVWGMQYLLLIILIIFKIFMVELFNENKHPFINIGITLISMIYIVLPFSLLNFYFYPELNFGFPSNILLVGFFIFIWGNDTFAYLSGMAIGKHKLFERISPKKTWEGTIGGGLFAVITAIVFSVFFKDINLFEWIGYALTIIIFGTFGDLFESLMKRTLGLKDSGNIMPGHGGILDRFDSILLAAPFAYIYIVFVLN
jgi:phosphatidate cytidylyltransferase